MWRLKKIQKRQSYSLKNTKKILFIFSAKPKFTQKLKRLYFIFFWVFFANIQNVKGFQTPFSFSFDFKHSKPLKEKRTQSPDSFKKSQTVKIL